MLSFFPRDVLGEIWDIIVFPSISYCCLVKYLCVLVTTSNENCCSPGFPGDVLGSFCAVLFVRNVFDEIWDCTGSVSEGFRFYFFITIS